MHRKSIAIITILLILSFSACTRQDKQSLPLSQMEGEAFEEEKDVTKDSIYVYVCGAVLCEGVYELPAGSRVYEAIHKAGGFTENAAVTSINQAEILKDETRLYVPTIEEVASEETMSDGKVNLNTATKEELMTLPGVGEAKAELIIRYREESGGFHAIEDIMNISGIKEGLFAKIKEKIKV